MFELALKARLPLIAVHTADTVNARDVITFLMTDHGLGCSLGQLQRLPIVSTIIGITNSKKEYLLADRMDISQCPEYFRVLTDSDKSLIFINPKINHPLLFDAGLLPTPLAMICDELGVAGFTKQKIDTLMPSLGGLNLLQVGEVCRLAMAKHSELTPAGIADIKMMRYTDTGSGVLATPLGDDFYEPCDDLERFIKREEFFFLEDSDIRLRPRGLLLHGLPGTGKSQAAKYIAKQWGVPLFRMDMASIMKKYVGQSERNMQNALAKIDSESPCIILIDEVEKVYDSSGSDTGVTSRMLGQLLWWMQEHESRVFTVMTSNNIDNLPNELYREGRIDIIITMKGLSHYESLSFGRQVLSTFSTTVSESVLLEAIYSHYKGEDESMRVSHSKVIQIVTDLVKQEVITSNGK